MTPQEINWKVEAWNRQNRQKDQDIFDLGYLIAVGVNDPKKFPKSVQKFRPRQDIKKKEDKEMCRRTAMVGGYVPH